MAFFNQEDKKARAPIIKNIMKKYGQKCTMGVRHHSTFIVKVKDVAGMFTDRFQTDYDRQYGVSVNPYWIEKNYADNPVAVAFLTELKDAMYGDDYFDESDPMTDYFHTSHYIDIDILPA
jgi:hypothetical protein